MNRIVLLALIATLGACESSADLRGRQAVFSGTTSRPAPEYAGCVQRGWQDKGTNTVEYSPTKDGVTLTVRGMSGHEVVLDVVSGRVTMFSRVAFGEHELVDVARRCL
ncbi:hypothetical protein [Caballeronia sp. LZ035]|uniref:hypothetical protein n=1 Tax=Caballeronia sp. LZ035 TaxID=3038568 RepID=UPI00285E6B5E|nr:hypothetical protein [Caballeronia sp. LZ035]MDR5761926.1 hypothetical protein [Caballeronia sp. LZ035]